MKYLTDCVGCGGTTSRKYAREHDGKCKACVNPGAPTKRAPFRERIIEDGAELAAILREEGSDGDCPW
jgi:hypothetical protein